jgi:hypothetical protein
VPRTLTCTLALTAKEHKLLALLAAIFHCAKCVGCRISQMPKSHVLTPGLMPAICACTSHLAKATLCPGNILANVAVCGGFRVVVSIIRQEFLAEL